VTRHQSHHVDSAAAVGRRLRDARLRAGLSQGDIAFPGCSASYVSRVEAGSRIPSLQVLRELAQRLGVSESYLATGTATRPEPPPLLTEAEVALRLDEVDDAERLFRRVHDEARSDWERAEALRGLGQIALRSGRPSRAVTLLEEALELTDGEPHESPSIAEALARSYAALGELAPAIALLESCVAALQDGPDPVAYVRFACLLGYALTDNGDFAGAERVVARALTVGREIADPYTRARLYWSQSRLLLEQGKSELAERYAQRTVELLRATDDTYALGHASQTLAHVYLDLGRAEEAAEVLRYARPLIEASGTPLDVAHFRIEEARTLAALGERESAAALAMEVAGSLGGAHRVDAGRTYTLLASAFEELGDMERAEELFELAVELLEDEPPGRYLIDAYRRLAALLKGAGRTEAALELLERAVATQERVGRPVY
jgi:tetratricopeptide (TPR) repeat protein